MKETLSSFTTHLHSFSTPLLDSITWPLSPLSLLRSSSILSNHLLLEFLFGLLSVLEYSFKHSISCYSLMYKYFCINIAQQYLVRVKAGSRVNDLGPVPAGVGSVWTPARAVVFSDQLLVLPSREKQQRWFLMRRYIYIVVFIVLRRKEIFSISLYSFIYSAHLEI